MRTTLTAGLTAIALIAGAPTVLAQAKDKQAASKAEQKDRLAEQDRKYFRQMAQANMAEVQAGKLALERAKAGEVKEFAQHMVDDHGRMLDEQRAMAKPKGVEVPKEMSKEHQEAAKKLQNAKGERFDRAYMSQMVEDHKKSLKLAEEAAKKAKDPQLRAMAEKAAPEIKKHLEMAKQVSDRAAAGGTAPSKGK